MSEQPVTTIVSRGVNITFPRETSDLRRFSLILKRFPRFPTQPDTDARTTTTHPAQNTVGTFWLQIIILYYHSFKLNNDAAMAYHSMNSNTKKAYHQTEHIHHFDANRYRPFFWCRVGAGQIFGISHQLTYFRYQKLSKRRLRTQHRRARIALAPGTLQCIPERFSLAPMAFLQPALITPLDTQALCPIFSISHPMAIVLKKANVVDLLRPARLGVDIVRYPEGADKGLRLAS